MVDEEGERTFEEVAVSQRGEFPFDRLTASAYFEVLWALRDRAGNESEAKSLYVTNDPVPPVVNGLTVGSLDTPGQPFSISAEISDNLAISGFTSSLAFGSDGTGDRLGIGRGRIWDVGEELVQSYDPGGMVVAPGSVEWLKTDAIPLGSVPSLATGVTMGANDLAGNETEVWMAGEGGGSTVSFGAGGMIRFDFNIGASSVPISATGEGAPTQVATTVQALYRPGSTLRTAAVAIFAGVPERGNKNVVAFWPVTELTPFTAFDRGTFIEVLAYPVIDATVPFFGLAPGIYALRAIAFDPEGNMLASWSHSFIDVR